MTVSILIGDVRERLAELPDDHFDCVVTSPPYWGLRDYGVAGQIGMEPTLGEHLAVMVDLFRTVRAKLKPSGVCWLNYGDCYATSPNGRSAADTKAIGVDDRTFRDKPFSTVGPIYEPQPEARQAARRGISGNLGNGGVNGIAIPEGRVVSGGFMKPKDLCMVPQRLFIALQEDGWWVRSVLPWVKRSALPESVYDRPANALEHVALMTRSRRYFYNAAAVKRPASPRTHARVSQDVQAQVGSIRANGGTRPDRPMKAVVSGKTAPDRSGGIRSNASFDSVMRGEVVHERNFRNTDLFFDSVTAPWGLVAGEDGVPLAIDIPLRGFKDAHFATFPTQLVEPLLLAGCPAEGRVLDPFGGAGTTSLVAEGLGLHSTSIELNPAYAAMAMTRIASALPNADVMMGAA